ncbi:exosome complex RNA-binding protein Rrp4 [Candidatus Pyrohabitans sp.]
MERKLVIPGEEVAAGKVKLGDGVYREGEKVYASVLGLLDTSRGLVRVIPLTGRYFPKVGDFVIGFVKGTVYETAWEVDINSPYLAILNAGDYYRDVDPFRTPLQRVMSPGTTVYAYVREVAPTRRIYITMRQRGCRVIRGGRLIQISPAKVPRVIGRKRSMISMIVKETGCKLLVGQNGRVWIGGRNAKTADLVERAIRKIEAEAHTSGLTDRIKEMIVKERERV